MMDFDLNKALDKTGDGLKDVGDNLKEAGDTTHKAASDFHKKFVSNKLPEMGKYGDIAQGAAEMIPGVGTYNAAVKGDLVGAATAAGIDIGAAAIGVVTAGTGYAAVKGGAAAAKAGLKIGAKEIAKTAVEKSVKEGVEKVTKEATEKVVKEGTEKVAKETAEKVTKEVASSTTEKAAVSTVAKSADEVGDVAKHGTDNVSKKLDDTAKLVVNEKLDANSARKIMGEVEEGTKQTIDSEQKALLTKSLEKIKIRALTADEKKLATNEFNTRKPTMIAEWEKHYGKPWPEYKADIPKEDGSGFVVKPVGGKYEAHHIIPKSIGGPNEWYNIAPAPFPDHQKVIHGASSLTNKLVREVNNVR